MKYTIKVVGFNGLDLEGDIISSKKLMDMESQEVSKLITELTEMDDTWLALFQRDCSVLLFDEGSSEHVEIHGEKWFDEEHKFASVASLIETNLEETEMGRVWDDTPYGAHLQHSYALSKQINKDDANYIISVLMPYLKSAFGPISKDECQDEEYWYKRTIYFDGDKYRLRVTIEKEANADDSNELELASWVD